MTDAEAATNGRIDFQTAADHQDDSVALDDALAGVGWEHTTDRTPYDNLVALVRALPERVDDGTIGRIAFRRITGLGPTVTPRALDRARERGEIE